MSTRIGIASFMQESNSFAPKLTELEDFDVLLAGDVMEFFRDTNSEIAGFIDRCHDFRWEPIPLLSANAISGGPLSAKCFATVCSRLISAVEGRQLDGLLVALHGAMSVETAPSGDAEVVACLRRTVGGHCPIVVTHDLHANLGTELLRQVNGLTGYLTYPHIDQRETGRRACSILARLLAGERSHHLRLPIPLLLSPQAASTFQAPLKAVMDRMASELRESEGTFATLFCVQPWLDFDPVASSLAVTQFGSTVDIAQRMRDIAAHLWSIREEFSISWTSPERLIESIRGQIARPILISEATDAPTGGGSGDHTGLLQCLLPHAGSLKACLYLVDPQFVAKAITLGIGAHIEAPLGASLDTRFSQPINFRATIEHISDGSFIAKGPAFHGRPFCMGPTSVLKTSGLRVVVSTKPVMMIDPELYRSQGIEPTAQDAIGIKSPLLFRAAYQTISDTVIHLDLPGPCRGRLEKVEFQQISRPIYPVDKFEWTPAEPEVIGT